MALSKDRQAKPAEPKRPANPEAYAQAREDFELTMHNAKCRLAQALRPRVQGLYAVEALAVGLSGGVYQCFTGKAGAGTPISVSMERMFLVALALGAKVRIQVDGMDLLPERCCPED